MTVLSALDAAGEAPLTGDAAGLHAGRPPQQGHALPGRPTNGR
jgi:hypothetical protein